MQPSGPFCVLADSCNGHSRVDLSESDAEVFKCENRRLLAAALTVVVRNLYQCGDRKNHAGSDQSIRRRYSLLVILLFCGLAEFSACMIGLSI